MLANELGGERAVFWCGELGVGGGVGLVIGVCRGMLELMALQGWVSVVDRWEEGRWWAGGWECDASWAGVVWGRGCGWGASLGKRRFFIMAWCLAW